MTMLKKVFASLLALVMLLTLSAAVAEDNSLQAVLDKGTFIIGLDDSFPPLGYRDENNDIVGFDIDVARAVAEKLGVEFIAQPISWEAKELELSSGNIDCIWNGFTMDGREDKYTWTDPYMDNSQVVVVRKDSGISGLDDLAGKIVEVQKESSAQSALEENTDLSGSFAQLLTVGEYNTAIMDLESGAVDAIAMDIFVAKDQLADKGDELVILDEQISSEKYAVGFLKGNTELRDQVQKTLEEMVADGTFAEISKKWFDSDVCILK